MLRLSKLPDFLPKTTLADTAPTRAGCCIVAATIVWAFVELPFELLAAQNSTAAALLLIETLLSALVALLTLHGVAWARFVFAIFCGMSIAVIVSSFASDMTFYPVWFALSLIELITKLGSLVVVCRGDATRTSGMKAAHEVLPE